MAGRAAAGLRPGSRWPRSGQPRRLRRPARRRRARRPRPAEAGSGGAARQHESPAAQRRARRARLPPGRRRDSHKVTVVDRICRQDGSWPTRSGVPGAAGGGGSAVAAGGRSAPTVGSVRPTAGSVRTAAGSVRPAEVTTSQAGPHQSASMSQRAGPRCGGIAGGGAEPGTADEGPGTADEGPASAGSPRRTLPGDPPLRMSSSMSISPSPRLTGTAEHTRLTWINRNGELYSGYYRAQHLGGEQRHGTDSGPRPSDPR